MLVYNNVSLKYVQIEWHFEVNVLVCICFRIIILIDWMMLIRLNWFGKQNGKWTIEKLNSHLIPPGTETYIQTDTETHHNHDPFCVCVRVIGGGILIVAHWHHHQHLMLLLMWHPATTTSNRTDVHLGAILKTTKQHLSVCLGVCCCVARKHYHHYTVFFVVVVVVDAVCHTILPSIVHNIGFDFVYNKATNDTKEIAIIIESTLFGWMSELVSSLTCSQRIFTISIW